MAEEVEPLLCGSPSTCRRVFAAFIYHNTQIGCGHPQLNIGAITSKANKCSKVFNAQSPYPRSLRRLTSVLRCSTVSALTSIFAFGRSRGSNCKHRDASRTSSVPSSFENWSSKYESMNCDMFLLRIKSKACITTIEHFTLNKATNSIRPLTVFQRQPRSQFYIDHTK